MSSIVKLIQALETLLSPIIPLQKWWKIFNLASKRSLEEEIEGKLEEIGALEIQEKG